MFRGKSPFHLHPIEQSWPRADTPSAWPVANPVFTCAHVTDVPSAFVADPFLWPAADGKVGGSSCHAMCTARVPLVTGVLSTLVADLF